MYNIAICDDDIKFISYIKKVLLEARGGEEPEFKIYEFISGEQLSMSLEQSVHYDLLVLDMQLEKMDGDKTAAVFREKFPDSVLVFCSGVRPPTIQSFKATPFRYLLKSQSNEEFVSEMKDVLKEVAKKTAKPHVVGHYRSNSVRILVKDIIYISKAKRGSRIEVRKDCEEADIEEPLLMDRKVEDITEEFLELGFALPHNSYLVNLNYVKRIMGNELILKNGENLTISRACQKKFKEDYSRFITNKY